MNLKVANLIAIQLGIFVGIMSWLAYSRLESADPRIAAELPQRVKPVVPIGPGLKADDQRPDAVDNGADRDDPQPIAEQAAQTFQQYSAAAVQHYSDLAAQQYYQQIAPRRHVSTGIQNRPVVVEAPSNPEVDQAPAVEPDYPAAETVAYAPPPQVIVYPQPQFVVFSDSRRFANRCRPASPFIDTRGATTHRRPDRPRPHRNGPTVFEGPVSPSATSRRPTQSLGMVQRRNDKVASCQPTEGFGLRARR